MKHNNITLRPARPDDVEKASLLLYSAFTHRKINYPPDTEEKGFVNRLHRFFCQKDNRFSYEFTLIAEEDGVTAGLVVSFAGRDEERLNTATGWSLEREAQDDEWYVDALAVFKNWGHHGIGTHLLQAAEEEGRQHHYAHVALHVAPENTEASSFYQHLHYVATGETSFYGHPYIHMIKQLK